MRVSVRRLPSYVVQFGSQETIHRVTRVVMNQYRLCISGKREDEGSIPVGLHALNIYNQIVYRKFEHFEFSSFHMIPATEAVLLGSHRYTYTHNYIVSEVDWRGQHSHMSVILKLISLIPSIHSLFLRENWKLRNLTWTCLVIRCTVWI